MLYDGALSNIRHAAEALDGRDAEAARRAILKAQDIVSELLSCLNVEQGGDIALNLRRLYLYVFNRLVQANVRKDRTILEEVDGILSDLRSAWAEIGKEVGLGARP